MYEKIISFDELYKGLKKSCKGVRWKDSTVNYEMNALRNTYELRQSLLNGTYQISKYQKFTVHEPKERDIIATRLKDRQFQRSLCDNGFYQEITKSFICDNCACQKGKGVDYTLKRVKNHLRKYYNQNGYEGWILKCDISHYFASIPHSVAKSSIRKRVSDQNVVMRIEEIIDSFEGESGIGLGSQVSQLIALAVLDDLDHFIKERLHIKYYIRYMDDFILIHPDKKYLIYCKNQIAEKLKEKGLELNSKKTQLIPLEKGFKLLKWHFYLTKTGAIVLRMDKGKISKEKAKLKKIYSKELLGKCPIGAAQQSLNSWLANANRGNTYFQQQEMINYFKQLEGYYGKYLQTSSQIGGYDGTTKIRNG